MTDITMSQYKAGEVVSDTHRLMWDEFWAMSKAQHLPKHVRRVFEELRKELPSTVIHNRPVMEVSLDIIDCAGFFLR
jgi:hypothetical protein